MAPVRRWWETSAAIEWGRKEKWHSSECWNHSNHLTSHQSAQCNMVVRSEACEIVTTAGGAVQLNTASSVWSVFSHRGAKTLRLQGGLMAGNGNKTCRACHLQDSVLYTRWKQNRTDGTAYGHCAKKIKHAMHATCKADCSTRNRDSVQSQCRKIKPVMHATCKMNCCAWWK